MMSVISFRRGKMEPGSGEDKGEEQQHGQGSEGKESVIISNGNSNSVLTISEQDSSESRSEARTDVSDISGSEKELDTNTGQDAQVTGETDGPEERKAAVVDSRARDHEDGAEKDTVENSVEPEVSSEAIKASIEKKSEEQPKEDAEAQPALATNSNRSADAEVQPALVTNDAEAQPALVTNDAEAQPALVTNDAEAQPALSTNSDPSGEAKNELVDGTASPSEVPSKNQEDKVPSSDQTVAAGKKTPTRVLTPQTRSPKRRVSEGHPITTKSGRRVIPSGKLRPSLSGEGGKLNWSKVDVLNLDYENHVSGGSSDSKMMQDPVDHEVEAKELDLDKVQDGEPQDIGQGVDRSIGSDHGGYIKANKSPRRKRLKWLKQSPGSSFSSSPNSMYLFLW